VEKSAVAAHPAICAQGLGDLSRNRVHQEKLKQKAGADDNGQHRLIISSPEEIQVEVKS
jgi:hypothetical protein